MAVTRKKTAKKKTQTRTRRGQFKAFKPTTAQKASVSGMSGASIPGRTIAFALGIAESTLFKHFKAQLEPNGGKLGTAIAIHTLISEMDRGGTVGVRAAIFWLKTRENELFSERRILENIDRQAADELGKLTDDDVIRIADNVKQAAEANKAELERFEKLNEPSIDDEPLGTA